MLTLRSLTKKISPLRLKLTLVSLLLLAIPCLMIGMIGFKISKTELENAGRVQLQNNVRFVIAMIDAINKEVKAGHIKLEDAQESVKQQILGPKTADGKRPINKRFNLGTYGYLFIINDKGIELAHPLLEGKDISQLKSPDGVMIGSELMRAPMENGIFVLYEWALPTDPAKTAPKITYAEAEPNWGWIVSGGSYKSDFDNGANKILRVLMITLGVSLLLGAIILWIFAYILVRPIKQIMDVAEQAASGDLRIKEIKIKSNDEIGKLASAVNRMVDNLREVIGGIIDSSKSVAAAAEYISASSEEIADKSMRQAQSASAITELFKELSTAINFVAASSEEAAGLSNETRETAGKGGKVVEASIDGMKKVNARMTQLELDSSKVGNIIEVIDDIAEQTNLLALNAAIEAARAGDQGRGFAVVAVEVRKLAERSSMATKEITDIIKAMQENNNLSVAAVADSVRQSTQTGEAFGEIIRMVNQSSSKVSEIAASSEEEAAQAAEVMQAVESIAAASEDTATASKETAETCQSLSRLSEELFASVSRFKI